VAAELSIVIPTYRRTDLLVECLKSLRAQSFSDFGVIVVDDASPQDVASSVCAVLPDAEVIRRVVNGGFAKAANEGIRAADSPFVMLLNDDMTLAPDCLSLLMNAMRESRVAMVCPLVLFRDQPEVIYSAGDRITRGGRPESIGYRQPRAGFEFERKPWGVSAGAAIYTRALFDAIGYFDESFVAYFEDSDLCWRARNAGFEAVCVLEAVAYHVGSASQAGSTLWRTRQCYRNHASLVAKNLKPGEFLSRMPWIAAERIHQASRVVSAARAESGLVGAMMLYAQSAAGMLKALSAALATRRRGPAR
jgi:GT2 family glycosyltransferase